MVSKYQKQHYEDVAGILRLRYNYYHSYEVRLALKSTVEAFAALFAVDNPPACNVGSHNGPCTATCLAGGFDRERFLKACGVARLPLESD